MIEQQVVIATKDGSMGCFTVHPDRGGPFPLVLFYMDAPGIREELRDMARRLASGGYYVMLPNMYYRQVAGELGSLEAEGARARMLAMMATLDIPMVMSDTAALLAHADTQAAADSRIGGTVGYCMSGQYAINACAHYPDRLKACASLYGVRLVTDAADSPHLAAARVTGEVYVAAAELDKFILMDEIDALTRAFAAGGVRGEVEVYRGVDHGFAFPQRGAYDKPAAERHWSRLNALFRRNLHPAG